MRFSVLLCVCVVLCGTTFAQAPGPWQTAEPRITGEDRDRQPDLWTLHFEFMPLRMMALDVPEAGGPRREMVWYLQYRVSNVHDADHLAAFNGAEPPPAVPRRFVPEFTVVTHDSLQSYGDRILPTAVDAIERREGPESPLLNSVEIVGEIAPTPERGAPVAVYGVATWTDVDPESDEFSVYVTGISNGYDFARNEEGEIVPGPDGEPRLARRTLRLDYYRPGDEFDPNEREIRLRGYEWVYR